MPTHNERIEGGLIGLLVGDALGVPYEFKSPQQLPPRAQIEFEPPAGFARTYSVPIGTWSDDGSQALCLLSSLLERGRFDADDFAAKLLKWHDGAFWLDNHVFDMGIATGKAIRALKAGVAPLDAGPSGQYDNGNGSLMRVLPLVLWHRGSDADLVRDARLQSRVTHGHLRAQICCALYCLWARGVLNGSSQAWNEAATLLREICADDAGALNELQSIRPEDSSKGAGSGYVVDCLRSARWAVEQGEYETAVKAAVALGQDTDTTACVAGGVAGVRDGVEAIPMRWREKLRGMEIVAPLLDGLLAR